LLLLLLASGQSFVNDPMMTDSSIVKAHIKLRFQNRVGQTCVAVRSLQITKRKTKLEFKQLDTVMRTTNDEGEKVTSMMMMMMMMIMMYYSSVYMYILILHKT